MRYRTWISMSVVLSGMLLTVPLSGRAQESIPAQPEKESCPACQTHMKNKQTDGDTGAERRQMHNQREAMHHEMNQALQQQLTALRDHAKAMDGVSDQTQLLSEMKKHQQMTDILLETLIEGHQKTHMMMHQHRQHRHNAMGHEQQTSERTTQPEQPDSQN